MSFSSEVKEELESKIDSARHCQLAELAALMAFCGRVESTGDAVQLRFVTENEVVARTYLSILEKSLNIQPQEDVQEFDGKKNNAVHYVVQEQDEVLRILQALKWQENPAAEVRPIFLHPLLVQKECCKRAFVRGAFLAAGSISDPNKFYHYEIVCDYEPDALQLCELLRFFNLDAKAIARKNNYIVYLKEGSNITDVLNVMGAFVSQMNLYNVMILKDMRNDVNRKVNCETANLNKTIAAAVKQIEDIEYIRDTVGLNYLKDTLHEIAELRLENTDISLKDLGEMLDPPVGKSGVNHRLKRISEIAEELREHRTV